jgi:putative spermidine/putrescine transport system ATP-binding protein
MSDRVAVFDGGRIQQVGTPQEIYEAPRSEFVARFVGTSNLLEPPVAMRLLGEDGLFAVRPEKISLEKADFRSDRLGAEQVVADGVVAVVVYAGAVTRYLVDLRDAEDTQVTCVTANHSNAEDLARAGDAVRLVLDRRHCRRLDVRTDDPRSMSVVP